MLYNIDTQDSKSYNCITCFEECYSLILKWLNKSNVILFCKSYFPHSYIQNELFVGGYDYISYDEIGRIHHIGNKMGYLKFKQYESDFWCMKRLFVEESQMPFIVKICPEKCRVFDDSKNYVENHLVLLYGIEKGMVFFYDTLIEKKIVISEIEFSKCYDHSFYYMFLGDGDDFEKKSKLMYEEHIKSVQMKCNDYSTVSDGDGIDRIGSILCIRDAFKITGILTERLIKYIKKMNLYETNCEEIVNVLSDRKKVSNKGFMLAEYSRQRGVRLSQKCQDMYSQLCLLDTSIMDIIFPNYIL